VLTRFPSGDILAMSVERVFRKPVSVACEPSVPPSDATRLLKLCSRLSSVVLEAAELPVVEDAAEVPPDPEEFSSAIRLCKSLPGLGRPTPLTAEVLALPESDVPCWEAVPELCACKAAKRLCMNVCSACAGSSVDELSDEDDEPGVDEVAEDVSADVELALELEAPVTPLCDSASRIAPISPPPDGGGGGITEESVSGTAPAVLDWDWVLLPAALS
jgi:hypothetical protein